MVRFTLVHFPNRAQRGKEHTLELPWSLVLERQERLWRTHGRERPQEGCTTAYGSLSETD